MDDSWCLYCDRQLEVDPLPPLTDESDFTTDDDDVAPPITQPQLLHRKAPGHTKARHGTIKVKPAGPKRTSSSGKLSAKGRMAISSAVNSAMRSYTGEPAVMVEERPAWMALYCSEECRREDERKANAGGLSQLEPPPSPSFESVKAPIQPRRPPSIRSQSSERDLGRIGEDSPVTSFRPALRNGSFASLRAMTPIVSSTLATEMTRSRSAGRSQSEDIGRSRPSSPMGTGELRLSSSVQSQPAVVVGTLRPDSTIGMRPRSLGRVASSKSLASPVLTGTSVSAHAYEPPAARTSRKMTHQTSGSGGSVRLSASPGSPSSTYSRSSISTAPSSSRWVEEEKPATGGGYALYHPMPHRNSSSTSLYSRSPSHANYHPGFLASQSSEQSLSRSHGPLQSDTISSVFRAGHSMRQTASSASLATMTPSSSAVAPLDGPAKGRRPPFLHLKHSSQSSDSSSNPSPRTSPGLVAPTTSRTLSWDAQGAAGGKRSPFVYTAMPDSPGPTLPRSHSMASSSAMSSGEGETKPERKRERRKRLFHFDM